MLFRIALRSLLVLFGLFVARTETDSLFSAELRIAHFDVDVTPPSGSPLAYDPMKEATQPLSCRGLVLLPEGESPIVLCAIDWLGVANQAQDDFRGRLAEAVGTTPDRVVMHALHQHDAPRCDLSAASVLAETGHGTEHYDVPFIESCIQRVGVAAGESIGSAEQVLSISAGKAEVKEVASNRRMLGPDGKVHTTRYTACKDPKIRALPDGVIDPWLRTVLFYGDNGPLAVITFYATHPQSYYRTGGANPDFPGMARNARQKETGVFHLHFNGAGGNIGAGKYNDGAHENRQVLADKVAAGMRDAWRAAVRNSSALPPIVWRTTSVALPLGEHLKEETLLSVLADDSTPSTLRLNSAKKLALLRRSQAGKKIDLQCLQLGSNYVLFLPGELFVEYQLAAQSMRPDENVLTAAYGEYGTGYIGTKVAYPQGGYEVSEGASNVAPAVERVLIDAMQELLQVPHTRVLASDFTDTFGQLPGEQ